MYKNTKSIYKLVCFSSCMHFFISVLISIDQLLNPLDRSSQSAFPFPGSCAVLFRKSRTMFHFRPFPEDVDSWLFQAFSFDQNFVRPDFNECTDRSHHCHGNSTCLNSQGSYACHCLSGFKGNGTHCVDIDECQTEICAENANCQNIEGSFRCACGNGYEGDGYTTCNNVDECDKGAHTCHKFAKCSDSRGSFICQCNSGFRGNGIHCDDVDECEAGTHNCHKFAECSDSVGSFECSCDSGYSGNGTHCSNIDECESGSHSCHKFAECSDTTGSFVCRCYSGLTGTGTHCDDIDECGLEMHNCDVHAICKNSPGTFTCECLPGYAGNGKTCNGKPHPQHKKKSEKCTAKPHSFPVKYSSEKFTGCNNDDSVFCSGWWLVVDGAWIEKHQKRKLFNIFSVFWGVSATLDKKKKEPSPRFAARRTLFELVISCLIMSNQRRARSSATIPDFCPVLIARDRAWYQMWNGVLLAANLGDGSFFLSSSTTIFLLWGL